METATPTEPKRYAEGRDVPTVCPPPAAEVHTALTVRFPFELADLGLTVPTAGKLCNAAAEAGGLPLNMVVAEGMQPSRRAAA